MSESSDEGAVTSLHDLFFVTLTDRLSGKVGSILRIISSTTPNLIFYSIFFL